MRPTIGWPFGAKNRFAVRPPKLRQPHVVEDLGGIPSNGPDASVITGLQVRRLEAWYGQGQVLFGLDLTVKVNEIVGIFGHNGAGKSTLLRAIAGLHREARYEAELAARRLDHRPPHEIARSGLVLVREGARVFEGLTVREHLQLGRRLGKLNGRGAQDLERIHEVFPILAEFRRRPASQLSGGQRQLLALGMAFASNPACLLLDEPSTGLAPEALAALYDALETLAQNGVALLIAEQNPQWLARLATRAYLLALGRIEGEGEPRLFLGAEETGHGRGPG